MNRITVIASASLLALSGCAQLPAWLQANGASATTAANVNTVLSTAVADGSLFCSIAGVVAAVPGVNVKGASAQSVATACATAQLVGAAVTAAGAAIPVPVSPPASPSAVPVATVAPAAASAVAASVKS
jgi:hypothetical protein